jgi:phasin family protein
MKTHFDAQAAYFSDMSKSMFRSFQRMCDLNIQLMQAMLEESTLAGKQVFSGQPDPEALSAAARTQPASDRLRAYQHHVSRLAADTQVELARVTEQHAQNSTRTARAMADAVARTASEAGMHGQQETVRRFADPVGRDPTAAQGQGWAEARSSQGGQGASQAASQSSATTSEA